MRALLIALVVLNTLWAETSLEERVAVLEKRLVLQTEQTILSVGGRICMDAVFNSQSVGGSSSAQKYDYYFSPRSIQPFSSTERFEGTANVKNSRFWVKTRRETEVGMIQTLLEIDFWGSEGNEQVSNAHDPRVRHAYVTLDEWLVGQSFSTFVGPYADTLQSSMDIVVVIQPQLRFETKISDDLALTLALEQPETTISTATTGVEGVNDEHVPDSIVRLRYVTHDLDIMAALLTRLYSHDSYASTFAWAGHINARYYLNGLDRIDMGFVKGNALGRYVAFNYFSDAVLINNTLVPQEIEGGHVSYQHWWNKSARSSIQASHIKNSSEYSYGYQANFRYSLVRHLLASVEYAYGAKQTTSSSQNVHRLYLSMQYDF